MLWNNGSSFSPVIPIFGFRYQSEDKQWSVHVAFPNSSVTYRARPELECGFSVEYSADLYELPQDQTFKYNTQSHYFELARLLVGPHISYGLSSNVFLNVGGGLSLLNKKQFTDRNKNVVDGSRKYGLAGSYLKAGLGIRF